MSEAINGYIKDIQKLGNGKHGVAVDNEEKRFYILIKAGMFYNQLVEAQKGEIEVCVFAKKLVEVLSDNCLGLVIDVREKNLFSDILEKEIESDT
jgi:hypothetical protein